MAEGYSDIILADNRVLAIRDWLAGTFAGRALLVGIFLKSAALALTAASASLAGLAGALDILGNIGLLVGASIAAVRLFLSVKRRLLWRVRRKLTLSYFFIGFVPALLIISFFLLCGLLLFFNVSAYLARSGIRSIADQARFLAQAGVLELQRAADGAALAEILAQRQRIAAVRYPGASYVVVPASTTCPASGGAAGGVSALAEPVTAGPWAHEPAPRTLPAWVSCSGLSGLLSTDAGEAAAPAAGSPDRAPLAVRAVALPDATDPPYALIVDIPITETVTRQLHDEIGIDVRQAAALDIEAIQSGELEATARAAASADDPAGGGFFERPLEWVAFLDAVDWETGEAAAVTAVIAMSIADIYRRISAAPVAELGDVSLGQLLMVLLAVVAGLFLIIEIAALAMGLVLARSITGSVHALFVGTERVRQGDFTHKIPIRTHDQLGELASSFNSMTASIEDLLEQKAEKERLAEELRIARGIQMSLLPQGPLDRPGLALAAHCEPAREVGGDYYDVLPIDEHRIGLLIADVAGKGTSAALYMAELKGVILSLSQRHRSPRGLLVDANRILSKHLDPRSFITVTYAIVDLQRHTLTHARAGHCPLLYLPGSASGPPGVQVLSPDGLVLGLQIDNGEMFDSLLEEVTVTLAPGDLFVLYTDGITEASNAAGEWFGDSRLAAAVEAHGGRPFAELRERILGEIRAFVGSAAQHDDMTMLLVRYEGEGAAA